MFHIADNSLDLLSEWRWLLGDLPSLVGWSAAGDLFVRDDDGRVFRLDTGGGEVHLVAPGVKAFEHALSDPDRAAELLLLPVVRIFEARHGALGGASVWGSRHCQSWVAPWTSMARQQCQCLTGARRHEHHRAWHGDARR